jgi:hypothetical protein
MNIIPVVDSLIPPTPEKVALAKAAGIGAWLGGFNGPGIAYAWTDADFQTVLDGGLQTGAYVSRLADPAAMKARAAALGIVIIQDDEAGIAPVVTALTDDFLNASGAGLYGGGAVMAAHRTHGHPCYIYAAYPGGIQTANWPPPGVEPPSPSAPTGWQYMGTHGEPYGTVDASNFDSAILGGMTPAQAALLQSIANALFLPFDGTPGGAGWNNIEILRRQLTDLGAAYSPSDANPFVPTPVNTAGGTAPTGFTGNIAITLTPTPEVTP